MLTIKTNEEFFALVRSQGISLPELSRRFGISTRQINYMDTGEQQIRQIHVLALETVINDIQKERADARQAAQPA